MTEEADPTAFTIEFDPTAQRMEGWTRHGNMHFDVPFISPVIDNLWQGGCQDGLILPGNIKHLISLYIWEAYTIKHDLDTKLYIKMYDADDVDTAEVFGVAGIVAKAMDKGGDVLVHCQAGLNRSSLIAVTALWLRGMRVEDAISLLREKRCDAVLCNPTFEAWVRSLDRQERPDEGELSVYIERVMADVRLGRFSL